MAYLEIETNEGTRRVSLEREHLSIGRLSYNDVMLPSPQISRQHAELRRVEGRWWIADLNSTNGLHLNERRIQEHLLSDGDVIFLAPNISLRFVEEAGDAQQTGPRLAASSPRMPVPGLSGIDWGAQVAQQLKDAASDPQAHRLTHPIGQPFPASAQIYPPVTPASSIAPLKPRSIYSDDEVPYVPPGIAAPPPPTPQPAYTPAPQPAPPARYGGPPTIPFSSWAGSAASSPASSTPNGAVPPGGNPSMSGDRYPAPPGPLQSGAGTDDPYRRSGPLVERSNPTGAANGTLLHVCQTCGQLTAPDAVYCQNCHHSIAHECSNCRLSLLPIQERCPRCHTPNEASVRRAHPGR
jgi:hypothetical protein